MMVLHRLLHLPARRVDHFERYMKLMRSKHPQSDPALLKHDTGVCVSLPNRLHTDVWAVKSPYHKHSCKNYLTSTPHLGLRGSIPFSMSTTATLAPCRRPGASLDIIS